MNSPRRISDRSLILILGMLTTVSPFAIDMYLPAFAGIAADFGTTPAKVSLSVVSYFVGLAFGQILYGPLLDRYGRKPPLYVGLTLFMLASLGCTQAADNTTLIVLRFFQAIGGCVAWVSSMTMVRDFFPVKESAKVFSLLVLILGVSPLLAPTAGGFLAVALGWRAIFVILAMIVAVILLIVYFLLPEGHQPDPTVSLRPGPMWRTFVQVGKTPQFYTYALAGAFSFAGLFIYVSGSPVIFMEMFQVEPRIYGGIFAFLSVAMIGGSQLNILLTKYYESSAIFRVAITAQLVVSLVFVTGTYAGWFGLYSTIAMFFLMLACVGIQNPNASALAMAPFMKNAGSAASLLGCAQIGLGALVSSSIGLLNAHTMLPIVVILTTSSLLAWIIMVAGSRRIAQPVKGAKSGVSVH